MKYLLRIVKIVKRNSKYLNRYFLGNLSMFRQFQILCSCLFPFRNDTQFSSAYLLLLFLVSDVINPIWLWEVQEALTIYTIDNTIWEILR